MHGETPEFKRCCFCLPLRRGLIGWGYFKLAVDVLAVIRFIYLLVCFPPSAYYQTGVIVCSATITFFFTDAVFAVLLVMGGHKKNHKLLHVSKIFSMVWLIPVLIVGGLLVYTDIARLYRMGITSLYAIGEFMAEMSFISTIIFIQVYVILLTRSEALKLQNQSLEMQFVNNAAEAEARCVSTAERSTDNGHNSVQYKNEKHHTSEYTDDGHDSSVQYETY